MGIGKMIGITILSLFAIIGSYFGYLKYAKKPLPQFLATRLANYGWGQKNINIST